MKSRFSRILAILMALAIVVSLAACGKGNTDTTTASDVQANDTTAGDTTAAVPGTTAATGVTGDTTATGGTNPAGETTTKGGGVTTPSNALPTTNAGILALYTSIMNKAKADKPGFKKYEYQELPDGANYRNVTPAKVMSKLLDLASGFMTTEEEAKAEPGNYAKGGDMKAFPLKDSAKGCLLTDAGAIKSATCVKQADGNVKLTMTLKDETNPAHYRSGNTAPSKIGGIFVPLDKDDVNPELTKFPVKQAISNAQYTMNYYNCTVTLVYNPVNQRVISVDQVLYNKMTLSGKVIFIGDASGWQVLVMHYNIFDITY